MFLAKAYDELTEHHADIVGFFYHHLQTADRYSPAEASRWLDDHDWSLGWRIEDVDNVIWSGGCPDDCVFNQQSTFITLETATMKVRGYGGLYLIEDVIADVIAIDEAASDQK